MRKIFLILTSAIMFFVMLPTNTYAADVCANGIYNNGLGGIYIDIKSEPYTTFAHYDMGEYAYTNKGCAWFASARVKELTGLGSTIYSGYSWYYKAYSSYGFSRGQTPQAGALACWSDHVAVVEKIDGSTSTAYISHGGWDSPADYGYCTIMTRSVDSISSIKSTTFYGYVYLGTSAETSYIPEGFVDEATGGIGTLYIRGWAYDPDTPNESLEIHVYIYDTNGSSDPVYAENIGLANKESTDLYNALGVSGNHRFAHTINLLNTDVVDGTYRVDFYAIGTNSDVALIGSKEVAITGSHSPIANFETAEGDYGMVGTVRVVGWAFDRDAPSSPVEIHMYIGGEAGSGSEIYAVNLGFADKNSTVVNEVYSQYGLSGGHRFDFTVNLVDTGVSGTQEIYLYAIDNYGVSDAITLIGHKTVTITENNSTKGFLDKVEGGVASLYIKGWAFDPDTPSKSVGIHMYIDGDAGSSDSTKIELGTANISRNDVNTNENLLQYNLTGNHGFEFNVNLSGTGIVGEHTIYLYALDTSGANTHTMFASATVNIINNSPIGRLETAKGGVESVYIAGWAFDPDTPSKTVGIHMYIDGDAGSSEATRVVVGSTNKYRNDVNTDEGLLQYNLTGNHGFEYYVDLSSTGLTGTHKIYLYALDTSGANTHTMFATATVDIEANVNPKSFFDKVITHSKGTLTVVGWAFDPNSPTKSVKAYASVGGEYGASGAYSVSLGYADVDRPDVNKVYSITGNHGIESVIDLTDTGLSGKQTVYLYAEDLNTGEKTLIGSKSVTVPVNHSPTAWFEVSVGYAGSLHIGGWAFDSDSSSESIDVEVYISDTHITTLRTDVVRNDVNNAYNITGIHGFTATIDLREFDITGSNEVHVYGVDLSGLKNSEATNSPKTTELFSPYTVEYDANGGNNTPESQEKAYGISLTLSGDEPVRDGFEFAGWNTAADGSGTAYNSGDVINTNSSLTLYAQWESVLGDIDENGSLEQADASLLLKYLAGIAELTEEQLEAADFNSDGSIDLKDVIAILRET